MSPANAKKGHQLRGVGALPFALEVLSLGTLIAVRRV